VRSAAVGQPLPRADDAFVDNEKWHGYVLADTGHGDDWRRMFGDVDPATLWSIVVDVVVSAPVVEVHDLGEFGVSCRVPISVTMNGRTADVRTVWHYDDAGSPPRLVTAFPTT
jgi:hypothetical protein